MKELNSANWIYWIGLLTITCMLLPVLLILAKKQFSPSFIALSIYFLSTFFYNFLLIAFPAFPKESRRYIGVVTNIIDAPLMLVFLLQFGENAAIKKLIRMCLVVFVLFEIVVILIDGLSVKSISIFSGPGILIILGFACYFFSRHVRIAIVQKLDIGKTMMISGILFAYAVYFMVYLFYYVLQTPNKADALIIYFLASIISSILVSSGLIFEKKPEVKKATRHHRIAL